MNRFIKYLFGLVLAVTFNACTDFVDPAIPYSDFETGVYLRTLSSTGSFNFFDLDNARFELMVEAVDEQDGSLVQQVEVFVRRRRGQDLTPEAAVKTIPASAFQPHSVILPNVHPASGSKYPAATINITVEEALSAMNLSKADIDGGDFFEFRLALTDTQGRVFTNTNLSPDIQGGQFYRSPFLYRVPVVCPSDIGGEYTATTTGTSTDTCCPDETTLENQTVTLTKVSGTTYEISDWSAGLYLEWYAVYGITPTTNLKGTITDACGNISGSFSEPFGTTTTISGSIDGVTGVITYTWVNGYDDTATVVLTPK